MKFTLLITAVLFSSFVATPLQHEGEQARRNTGEITSLIINAHVTVVLVNTVQEPVKIGGEDIFLLHVVFKQSGGKLVIESTKKRDLKNKGVIYIPAASLKYIEINSSASVRSADFLEIPQLRIQVNGECKVDITNRGQLNILEGPEFEIRQKIKKRQKKHHNAEDPE